MLSCASTHQYFHHMVTKIKELWKIHPYFYTPFEYMLYLKCISEMHECAFSGCTNNKICEKLH